MRPSDPLMGVAATAELDVRGLPKVQRDQMIFARFDALSSGESFVFTIRHDPRNLRQQFVQARPGAYDWRYLEGSQFDRLWRIRIIKISDGPPTV